MPKIIFRPAPTPPPFVPPTPVPTENIIHLNPRQFSYSDVVSCYFENLVNVPEHDVVEFRQYSEPNEEFYIYGSIDLESISQSSPYQFTADYSSAETTYFYLVFFKGDDNVGSIILNFD